MGFLWRFGGNWDLGSGTCPAQKMHSQRRKHGKETPTIWHQCMQCTKIHRAGLFLHCKKELAVFPSPAGMSLIKLFLGGNNLVFSRPERVWSVTSRLGAGKWLTLFYSVCPYISSLWCELAYWSLRCCTATHSLQHDTVRVRKALEIILGGLETTVHHIMSPQFCTQKSQKHDPLELLFSYSIEHTANFDVIYVATPLYWQNQFVVKRHN